MTIYNCKHLEQINISVLKWDHLEEINMTYYEHLQFSLKNSLYLLCGAMLGVIHAFCPAVLVTIQSDTIAYVGKRLTEKHAEKKSE
jgi:uncharacterized membrane protein